MIGKILHLDHDIAGVLTEILRQLREGLARHAFEIGNVGRMAPVAFHHLLLALKA